MNDKFESQKETLLSIKQEISLLYQQVNYLLRNEKPLELLDLDVLMNRTHTLYDQLCSISVGDEPLDEDLPFDADDLSSLFEGMKQEQPTVVPEENIVPEEKKPEETVPEERSLEAKQPETVETVESTNVEAAPAIEEEKPLGNEFGFFFRFEDVQEPAETVAPDPVEERPDALASHTFETEGKVVHVMEEVPMEEIPERDRVHGEDLVKDNPLEMPVVENDSYGEEPIEFEKPVAESVSGFFENDDAGFELSTPETLGEKMMQEDNSLAAKLQQNPVHDLKSVIGINDKFLLVNELFGGSMEKYNKSIDNLNDLKTLNGALIYLNELKIELQWNSSNEAYQKLKELVSRKFE